MNKPLNPQEQAAAMAAEQAAIEADLAKNPRDEAEVPGGRYKRGDIFVNAEGQEIDKTGKVKKQDGE